jgi:hypothetical protein
MTPGYERQRAMKWSEVRPGVVVYHNIYVSWGKGVVQQVLTSIFDPRIKSIEVKFEGIEDVVRQKLPELRSKPNRKRIVGMIDLYAKRGVQAIDAGDRYILPDSDKGQSE